MGEFDALEALADSTRDLLRELAAVRAESEALRRELEETWVAEDERPTVVPRMLDWDELDWDEWDDFDRRDTLRCA